MEYRDSVVPLIEAKYGELSPNDRVIADFFINNSDENIDLRAKTISKKLYVSESALSRFAQKVGYTGYREFVYRYKDRFNQESKKFTDLTKSVLNSYQDILDKTFSLISEKEITQASFMLNRSKKVFVYGHGNSAMCAQEFKIRFMRLGLNVESITDVHIMKMNSVLLDSDSLVIFITVSGETMDKYINEANKRNCPSILITTNSRAKYRKKVTLTLLCASKKNLDVGNVISPQIPILVLIDLIYAYYLKHDFDYKTQVFQDTLVFKENIKK